MKLTLGMPVAEFCRSIKLNRLFGDLERAYIEMNGRSPTGGERDSWAGSLPRLGGALEIAGLPHSAYVGIEVQVPYYSERIDVALFGYSQSNEAFLVLVELKQWSEIQPSQDAAQLCVRMRSGLVPVVHPSIQVLGYRQHLKNFVRAFQNEPKVQIACCVYAHNYSERGGPLFAPEYTDALSQARIFCATDAEKLSDFINTHVGKGNGAQVLDRIRRGGLAPSRVLVDRANELIHRQDVFTMLDDQIPAQRSIVTALEQAIKYKTKSIILVNGGPGTGKSVIALDAFGSALRKNCGAFFVSGSAAFTYGMRQLLGSDLASLVRFTDFFWQHAENSIDVLVIDEAHRIRNKSVPKVVAQRRPQISQLEELIRAARVTVLFMDTNQIIEPDETGDPTQVANLAERLRIRFVHHRLRAQFRCDGSDDYLRWADELFALNSTEVIRTLRTPETFDFDVIDSPHEVLAWVLEMNRVEHNSARLTAGWCWPWSDPRTDGTLVDDIVIGDFTFPWELKNGKRAVRGIPEAKYWAVDPAGVSQAGTVYSVQGFEFRHVGVLMGPDLVVRNGKWLANPRANFRNSIRGKAPEVASLYLRRIYRALFTRPLRSARVYSVDEETRAFIRSTLASGTTTLGRTGSTGASVSE